MNHTSPYLFALLFTLPALSQVPFLSKSAIENRLAYVLAHPLTGYITCQENKSYWAEFKNGGQQYYKWETILKTEEQLRSGIENYYKYHASPYLKAHDDIETMRQQLKLLREDVLQLCQYFYEQMEPVDQLFSTIEKVKLYYDIYTAALKMVKSMPEYIDATTPE